MNSVTYSYHQISVSPLLHWDRMLASSNLSWIETHERLTWTKWLQRPQRSTTKTTSFSQCSFTRISWCLLCLRKKPQLFPFNHCTIQIRTQNGPVTLPVVGRAMKQKSSSTHQNWIRWTWNRRISWRQQPGCFYCIWSILYKWLWDFVLCRKIRTSWTLCSRC